MTWRGSRILGIVPARGGSKGIPRKNLARIGGRSLVGWAADTARSLAWLDRAELATDDPEIAEEGRAHGLDVPFLRPAELATDTATAAAAWSHAWRTAEAHYDERFDVSIYLQPTSPFRRASEIEECVRAVVEGGHQAAATVSRVPGHFTPHKTLTMASSGVLGFFLDEGARHSNRQSIPTFWHRNGLCYAVRRATLLEHGHIVETDCVGVVVDRHVVNIDEPVELAIAEALLARGLAL